MFIGLCCLAVEKRIFKVLIPKDPPKSLGGVPDVLGSHFGNDVVEIFTEVIQTEMIADGAGVMLPTHSLIILFVLLGERDDTDAGFQSVVNLVCHNVVVLLLQCKYNNISLNLKIFLTKIEK